MSAIGAIGQGVEQYLQSISVSAPTASVGDTASTANTNVIAESTGQQVQGAGRHHRHGGGGAFKQIEQAVASALQNTSSGSSSANTAIQTALENLFASFGKSTSGTTGSTSNLTAASGSNGATVTILSGDGDGDSDTPGISDQDSSPSSFAQMLQSYGVTAQQFHQDFQAALQQANGGQADLATAFRSFPPGTLVDTTG